jgi:hypothetical protein
VNSTLERPALVRLRRIHYFMIAFSWLKKVTRSIGAERLSGCRGEHIAGLTR